MTGAGSTIAVAELRAWLKRAEGEGFGRHDVLPFGLPSVDEHLPGGGLALGALHEVSGVAGDAEYASAATLFAAGMLARLPGTVLWCLRGRDLFAPALARVGLQPDRVIFCETWKDREVLPAMEEGLRCAGLSAVVGEVARLPLTASRRLQLAAERNGVMALALRRFGRGADRALAAEPIAAVTRWQIAPAPSGGNGFLGLGRALWQVDLVRVRGGEPHSWLLEGCDAQGRLALPAALADRPAAAEGQRRAALG
jgi:protein ImuA